LSEFTHFDHKGDASMVDVGDKNVTKRVAIAKGRVHMTAETLQMIQQGDHKKGDVLAVARLAGIMAAKKTSDLIPLCHPLALDKVAVELDYNTEESCVEIEATASLSGRTGVEMEALTAVTVAGLTVYDMCKAVDKGMQIDAVRLVHKSGGKSGTFEAE
jgi:cyclic pyranopterin phosphate synthase